MDDAFRGEDRRRHRVFVTRNTEYHVRDGYIVAARDRKDGRWLEHAALGMQVRGHVERDGLIPKRGDPEAGQRLYLARPEGSHDIVTSVVVAIERPAKEIVATYPRVAA